MATQHPDSTVKITTKEEVSEALNVITPLIDGGFGCDEIMVDYEGKLTAYHQPEWIVQEAYKKGFVAGKDFLITVRAPNDILESESRHLMTLMAAILANLKSSKLYDEEAVHYIVLPMTENPRDIVSVQRKINKLKRFVEEEAGYKSKREIHVIPLFELVRKHVKIDYLLEAASVGLVKDIGHFTEAFRVFLGKSDASLHSGHVASTLSLKLALAKLHYWASENYVKVYPIIGMGKPPFRGHLAPHNIENWVKEFKGYSTVTIQSALRYNTPRSDYVKTYVKLKEHSRQEPSEDILEHYTKIMALIRKAEEAYLERLSIVAKTVWRISQQIPQTRDRVTVREYKRKQGEIVLPRAIKFVASMYTIGYPPALLGLGLLLERISKGSAEELELLLKTYPSLIGDIAFEMKYYVSSNLRRWIGEKAEKLISDVEKAVDILSIDCEEPDEKYLNIVSKITLDSKLPAYVIEAANIRGFLG